MHRRALGICLLAAFALIRPARGGGQEVRFSVPVDDPNTNSEVTRSAAFSPDGTLLAVGYGRFLGMFQTPRPGQTILWDVKTGRRKETIAAKVDGACGVAFSPDGKTLAIAEFPGSIRLWDVGTGRERLTLTAPSILGGAMAFCPDGKQLAAGLWPDEVEGAGTPDSSIMLWDPASGKEIRALKGHSQLVHSLAFSPDGRTLASGGEDGLAKLWRFDDGHVRVTTTDVRSMVTLTENQPLDDPFGIHSLAFSPDGRILAIAAGYRVAAGKPNGTAEVILWSLDGERKRATLRKQPAAVLQVAFSRDGKLLATACEDGRIRLWDGGGQREICSIRGEKPIAFSPDGRNLAASAGDKTMVLRDLAGVLHP